MAPKPEDTSEYHSTKAKLKRAKSAAGNSLPALFWDEAMDKWNGPRARNPSITGFMGNNLILSSAMVCGAFNVFGLNTTEQTIFPDTDMTVPFSATLDEGGYFAISSDNGATGYVLSEHDGAFALYQFDETNQQSEHYVLDMIEDPEDAWHISRSLQGDFANLSAAIEDAGVTITSPSWEVVSLGNISEFVMDEEGNVERFASEITEIDRAFPSISETYSQMYEQWNEASETIANGYTVTAGQDTLQNKGEMSTIEEFDNTSLIVFATLASIGGMMTLIGSGPGAVHRRKQIKAQKKSMKP